MVKYVLKYYFNIYVKEDDIKAGIPFWEAMQSFTLRRLWDGKKGLNVNMDDIIVNEIKTFTTFKQAKEYYNRELFEPNKCCLQGIVYYNGAIEFLEKITYDKNKKIISTVCVLAKSNLELLNKPPQPAINKITIDEFFKSPKKLAIHCNTEEKAKKLLDAFGREGYKWRGSGEKYSSSETYYNNHKDRICYGNNGLYSDIDTCKSRGFTIIEFEDMDLTSSK